MTESPSDRELIASSLDQPERFARLFDRHGASVYRYLRRRVGDQLAEELTAETFMRALRARRRFDSSRDSALPWLYGIAVNLIRMHARSEHRRERAHRLLSRTPLQTAFTVEVEARVDAQALAPALRAVLEALPPDQREVLLLNAWAGLSPAEIAQTLSISGATARKRLHRARVRAAEALERHHQDTTTTISEIRTAP